ncbi:MAG TPA: pyridoxamine 5'-phosphate oxidase family protein [Acidimicrobiales bacterium]|nr:pyridoxamine 5'-phosphate oxidase family protein [Acidimicrobiales bacterium]
MTEDATLEEIPEAECLQLLASHAVGRIAVVADGRPHIFPVNYVIDGRTVAFRTDPGTKLSAATLGRVAFEIDGTDSLYHAGWSVVVHGVGQEITGDFDEWSQRMTAMHLEPWAGGAKEHWVAISSPAFSGRRIRR